MLQIMEMYVSLKNLKCLASRCGGEVVMERN